MEAAVAHAARELEALHDLHDVLDAAEYDDLARSHTNAIPSASTSAELKCILIAINEWELAAWISADARVAIANCMKESFRAASTARAAAVAAESAFADANLAGASGSRNEAGAARQLVAPIIKPKARANQPIALQPPVLQANQRSITDMMGAKTFTRTIRNVSGEKVQQSMEVIAFPSNPFAPPPAVCKCSFGCGDTFTSLQARVSHEIHRHGGRDGVVRGSIDIFGVAKSKEAKLAAQSVIECVITAAIASIHQLELERNPEQRDAHLEREARRKAEAEAKLAADALAKAERTLRWREREEAGGGRRGELKRHQYTAQDKLRYLEVFDKIRFDQRILNKGEAFKIETGVPETNVLKWAKPEERAKISRGGKRTHVDIFDRSCRLIIASHFPPLP
jgi:hypothetical protein